MAAGPVFSWTGTVLWTGEEYVEVGFAVEVEHYQIFVGRRATTPLLSRPLVLMHHR